MKQIYPRLDRKQLLLECAYNNRNISLIRGQEWKKRERNL